jgi:hypothetical protein
MKLGKFKKAKVYTVEFQHIIPYIKNGKKDSIIWKNRIMVTAFSFHFAIVKALGALLAQANSAKVLDVHFLGVYCEGETIYGRKYRDKLFSKILKEFRKKCPEIYSEEQGRPMTGMCKKH